MGNQRFIDYKVLVRRDNPIKHRGIIFNERVRHVSSKKNGSNPDKFLKDFLEIIDVLTFPVGYVEANCEWMLKEYYVTNGKEGWSPNTVIDFLIKLKRKPSFALELVTKVELEFKEKNGVDSK